MIVGAYMCIHTCKRACNHVRSESVRERRRGREDRKGGVEESGEHGEKEEGKDGGRTAGRNGSGHDTNEYVCDYDQGHGGGGQQ